MNKPIAATEYGKIEGIELPLSIAYLGVPFAKPPLGELRFRHPVKPDPWEGILPCKKGKANPIQTDGRFALHNNCSEDCLYLNIYVPKNLTEPVPTMFWIHGGAYEQGGVGALKEGELGMNYDLSLYANETNTVVVTVGYRLGLFGFLHLHSLSDRFDSNNALYDLKMALEFVHDNIAAFGGDPNNITVFGESAGGALTLAMLASDLTHHLFQKAIVQSACVDHFWTEKEGKRAAKILLRTAHIRKPEDILNTPVEKLCAAAPKANRRLLFHLALTSFYSPIIDGVFLKEPPRESIKRRSHPIFIGTIANEGDLFVSVFPSFVFHFMSMLTPIKVKRGKAPIRQRAADAIGEYMFQQPANDIASTCGGPSWMFYFDHVTKEMADLGMRSIHSADVGPLFHMGTDYEPADDPNLLIIGKRMRQIWKAFAYGKPEGKPYKESKEKIIITLETCK